MTKMIFSESQKMTGWLNILAWTASLFLVAFVLCMAMYHQYFMGEIPCPLCLLQRVAFLGFAYGAMMQFLGSHRLKYVGVSLFFASLLLVISGRQSLLDICHTQGHEWVGSAIWNIHMPVWSFILGLGLVFFVACDLIFITPDHKSNINRYVSLKAIFNILVILIIFISGINFISTFIQCGLYNCHTTGYLLLQ